MITPIDTIYVGLNRDPETGEKVWFADAHWYELGRAKPHGQAAGWSTTKWQAVGELVEFLLREKIPLANAVTLVYNNPLELK